MTHVENAAVSARDIGVAAGGKATLGFGRLELGAAGVVLAPAGALGHVTIDAPDIDVPALADVAAAAHLSGDVRLIGGAARGSARLDVDLGAGTVSGGARFVAPRVALRVGKRTMVGSLAANVTARPESPWIDVSGSTATFRGAGSKSWWASARLDDAHVTLEGGGRFEGQVVVGAKDASPVTSYVEERVPTIAEWAVGAIATGGLRATGEVIVGPSNVQVRSVRARGEGFDMGFEYAKLGARDDLAVLLDVGIVRAGVGVSNGKTDFYLFGAGPWFAARTASMRAAAQVSYPLE
jgi:hypothetical protein